MLLRRLAAVLLAAAVTVAGGQLVGASPAAAAPRVLYYDASQAQEFVSVVHQGARNWNSRVSNVRLEPVPAGRTPNIRVYADNGWPRAYVSSLGNGRWYMGRQAVNQGYHQPRIATHEFGHLLGLPDRRTGLCADLMSGSSAPVSCTNEFPNTREAAAVNAAFRSGTTGTARSFPWQPAGAVAGDVIPLVVNGRPASENYSFLTFVSGCTGSLVKESWVVTARHCPTPASVRVGSINRSSGGTVVRVVRGVNHPTIDVKLLQLASAVGHAPAPIPTTAGPVGTATRIIGWGQTCPRRGCGAAPTVANELDTSIVADSRCRGINAPYELCTNNTNGNAGACYGDSGGPQVRSIDGRWYLIGATSRSGNGSSVCATGPSIYGDLPSIRPWISTQVGGLPA
jgi:snapalysin